MNERIKELRKSLDMNQTEFGNKIGVKQTTIAGYETGVRTPIDSVILSMCREFNVNEEWLRTGKGEMFLPVPEEDEVASYVAELLEPDNPFTELIVQIMRTYSQLDSKSQEVLLEFSRKLKENIKKEG